MKKIRERIIELRKELGFTRTEFAARVGVSASYIHIIETGRQEPTLRVLESIARAFDIPIIYFFEDIDISEKPVEKLVSIPVKGKISERKLIQWEDGGTITVPQKWAEKNMFFLKYEGSGIKTFDLKNGDFILVSSEDVLRNKDRVIVLFDDTSSFATLSFERGNWLLRPALEGDYTYILESKKFKILKINRIVRLVGKIGK
ncbi:MAG TPA: XRE family transcriptional regulator [Thermodesulfobacterium geofontis]|nr:XRE family transcriptional regulator [Thermodesulfobacterium geofontis]